MDFDDAIELKPKFSDAYFARAECNKFLGWEKLAKADLKKAKKFSEMSIVGKIIDGLFG